jgi:hypothetical protein
MPVSASTTAIDLNPIKVIDSDDVIALKAYTAHPGRGYAL